MTRRNILLFGLVGFIAFLSGGWLLQRDGGVSNSIYQKARVFENVVAYVADYYVDQHDEREIYDMAIDGLLKELNDPYSLFLRPDDIERLTVSTTGNYGGLGIRIEVSDGWITVVTPLPETPAERAGVQAGDRIVEVEGESAHDWSIDEAVSRLRGPPGEPARITISRPGVPDPLRFTITRERIHAKSVQFGTVLPGDIGYVAVATISEASAQELSDEVERLRDLGARSLILDLRANPGGLLNEGVAVADLFLDRGQVVVETRGRAPGASGVFRASRAQAWSDLPLVVLVNQASASAAEIIAGALQDHDRALIVGVQTFGKGLVQTVFDMGPGPQALKLTTGRWHTPSGRMLERPGLALTGTVVAESVDSTPADSALTFYTDAGRVVYGGGGIKPDRIVRPDTLTEAEQRFWRALGSRIPEYRSVMTTYALDLKGENSIADPNFVITRAMRRELVRRLQEREIDLPDSVWAGAAPSLDRQLGWEVARYVFGREAEIARQMPEDAQVQAAIALLRRAGSPSELLTLGAEGRENSSRN